MAQKLSKKKKDEKRIMKRQHFDWEMNYRPNVADEVAEDQLLIFPLIFICLPLRLH